jgi:hypothetical protein
MILISASKFWECSCAISFHFKKKIIFFQSWKKGMEQERKGSEKRKERKRGRNSVLSKRVLNAGLWVSVLPSLRKKSAARHDGAQL